MALEMLVPRESVTTIGAVDGHAAVLVMVVLLVEMNGLKEASF